MQKTLLPFSTATLLLQKLIRPLSTSPPSSLTNPLTEIIKTRTTAKTFLPPHPTTNPPLTPLEISTILKNTLRSPTAFNIQPYAVVLLKSDSDKNRERLNDFADECMLGGNIPRVKNSLLTAVFLSDLTPSKRLPRILQMEMSSPSNGGIQRADGYLSTMPLASSFFTGEGDTSIVSLLKGSIMSVTSDLNKAVPSAPIMGSNNASLGVGVWSVKNTMIPATYFTLLCESLELNTCMMEGFDPRRLNRFLNVPVGRYVCPVVVSVGRAKEEKEGEVKGTMRLDVDEVFFYGKFGGKEEEEEEEEVEGESEEVIKEAKAKGGVLKKCPRS